MRRQLKAFVFRVKQWYCATFHDQILWPINGVYRCRKCLRIHFVQYEEHARVQS